MIGMKGMKSMKGMNGKKGMQGIMYERYTYEKGMVRKVCNVFKSMRCKGMKGIMYERYTYQKGMGGIKCMKDTCTPRSRRSLVLVDDMGDLAARCKTVLNTFLIRIQ